MAKVSFPLKLRRALPVLGLASVLSAPAPAQAKMEPGPVNPYKIQKLPAAARPFLLEALVDFPDDIGVNGRALTSEDIDAMMAKLAELGIRRVVWSYYGDGHGGWLDPTGYIPPDGPVWKNCDATYRGLGNPLRVAVTAGHRHGLEVYAYFKPYETGDVMFPKGTPEAKAWGRLDCIGGKLGWMDPFVQKHPELRIKRRSDDIPDWVAKAPIAAIRLTKRDALPTRITKDHLQIWTSPDNFRYRPAPVEFTLTELVEPARRDARDQMGRLLTRQGDLVRVLTLSGLELKDNYILVTTDFTGGTPDFVNSGLSLMTALDRQGREIPGVFASGGSIWCEDLVDFRKQGLLFDYGWDAEPVTLDAPNSNGKRGLIGFARGRNEYLPGALCETEPAVQDFWARCLGEMIAAGVDGVDFREENHSTHTDHPEDYGFNSVVLKKAKSRPGDLLKNIAEVRGEAYTEFLRKCKARLAKAGKIMRYNLNIDFFRPDPPPGRLLAYPANLRFEWQRWVGQGLMDEAVLRMFSLPLTAIFDDTVTQEMIARCQSSAIPMTVNRYVTKAAAALPAELERVKSDGRFSGFIFYETNSYLRFGPNPGEVRVTYAPVLEALRRSEGGVEKAAP